jgi:hypothetical protein
LSGILNQIEQIDTTICYVDVPQATDMLLSGQVHFAVSCPMICHENVSNIELLTEPIGLVLTASHPLADQKCINVKCLEAIPIHGLSKENYFRRLCDTICATHGIRISYATENNMSEYNKLMISNDSACGFLSTLNNFESVFRKLGNYVYLSIDDAIFYRKMGISYLTTSEVQYKYSGFISKMTERIDKLNYYHNILGREIMVSMLDTIANL